jgi:hypothetical protein
MSERLAITEIVTVADRRPSRTLEQCEADIERGSAAFLKVGNALLDIQDGELYAGEYESFEDYCQKRWGFSRSTGYDYRNAALTHQLVGTSLQPKARLSFSHYVVLSRMLPRGEMLTEFVRDTDLSTVTVRALSDMVEGKLQPALGDGSGSDRTRTLADKVQSTLDRQQTAIEKLISEREQEFDESAKRSLAKRLREMARTYKAQADKLSGKVIEGKKTVAGALLGSGQEAEGLTA